MKYDKYYEEVNRIEICNNSQSYSFYEEHLPRWCD